MICSTAHPPPLKKRRNIPQNKKKKPKKKQASAIQGHVPWLNLKKNVQMIFSQYANNIGTA